MSDSRRIYFAVPGQLDTLTGGYGYDREIIAGLIRLGWQVEIVPLPGDFPRPSPASLAQTSVIFAGLPKGAEVIVDGLAFGVMDKIANAERIRLKLIALCHHPLALETGLSTLDVAAFKESETRALAAAAAIIVTSAETARVLMQDFAVPSAKIALAQPGTRREPLDNRPISSDFPPVLLTVATLTKRKGHDILIRALSEIQHLRWQARFVGGEEFDPSWAAQLHGQVENAQLGGRIDFVGGVTDTAAEFRRADIFVLPSRFEGYGMAFAEALSFGLPVLGARAGAVPDVVPEYAGILVPPEDSSALAAALTRLLTDTSFYQQLHRGAQRAAQSLPTWEQSVLAIAQLLRTPRFL
jgi:glycosyltransferase involved in cell wall biosynthesis